MRKFLFSLCVVLSMVFTFSQKALALYIRDWLICGPFQKAELEDEVIQNEPELSPQVSHISSGKEWRELNSIKNIIDLEGRLAFGMNEESVGYAFCKILSNKDQIVLFKLRSDDGIKVWLNGENIITNDVARGLGTEEDIVTAYLTKGENRLLIKVSDHYGGWGFSCDLVSIDGSKIAGLKFEPAALSLKRIPVKNITASSIQGEDSNSYSPLYAVDADEKTRWSSQHADPQYVTIEFNKKEKLKRIGLLWEAAYAKKYVLSTSLDGENWQEIYSTDSGEGGHQIILLEKPVEAKFLKLVASERGTDWGYSLWEIEIYGKKQ